MDKQLETRHLTADLTELEVRSSEDGKQKISGYAARFNVLSENLGGFREKIAPGAFTRSINEAADVVAVVDHDEFHGAGGFARQALVVNPAAKIVPALLTATASVVAAVLLAAWRAGAMSWRMVSIGVTLLAMVEISNVPTKIGMAPK